MMPFAIVAACYNRTRSLFSSIALIVAWMFDWIPTPDRLVCIRPIDWSWDSFVSHSMLAQSNATECWARSTAVNPAMPSPHREKANAVFRYSDGVMSLPGLPQPTCLGAVQYLCTRCIRTWASKRDVDVFSNFLLFYVSFYFPTRLCLSWFKDFTKKTLRSNNHVLKVYHLLHQAK